MSSLAFEDVHLHKENLDFDDEIGATFLGYFDDAEPIKPAFDSTLEKLEQPIDFDFGDANIRK